MVAMPFRKKWCLYIFFVWPGRLGPPTFRFSDYTIRVDANADLKLTHWGCGQNLGLI